MLHIERGDVVRQQHDFVGPEFALIFLGERGSRQLAHEVNEEVARAGEGVEKMDARVAEALAKFLLQQLANARDHEADDRRRRVHDTHRVGHLHGEALEEALVNSVQELLLLGEILDGCGGALDGEVEAVELLEEVGAVEMAGSEGGDHFLNLDGDNVAAGEVRVFEDGAEESCREQMLDQHLFDGGVC